MLKFPEIQDRLHSFLQFTVDPWRPQTPHSDDAVERKDTILRPFKLIPSACYCFFLPNRET